MASGSTFRFSRPVKLELQVVATVVEPGIERDLLRADEIAWLDAYHATVRSRLAPLLSGAALDWLLVRTMPL